MADPISRVCLILAASNLTSPELRTFGKWLHEAGSGALSAVVDNIRESADSGRSLTLAPSRAGRFTGSYSSSHPADETIQKIENMLIHEVGLGKVRAAAMLHEVLSETSGGSAYIPDYKKVALTTWLGRVLERVPESELLHVATKLRNELAHSEKSSSDWALRTKK